MVYHPERLAPLRARMVFGVPHDTDGVCDTHFYFTVNTSDLQVGNV